MEVELSPTITSLQGPTDVGKSSVLRALRWACLNDLAGNDFIQEGADAAAVMVTFVSGEKQHTVTRSKGARENLYGLNGDKYRSFGAGVPESIAALLDLNEINFQGQHDAPFWFNETAGEVSRRLNAVIDLSIIDQVVGRTAGEIRNASERVDVCQERLGELEAKQAALQPQLDRIADYEKLHEQQEAQTKREATGNRLARMLERIGAFELQYTTASAQCVKLGVLRKQGSSFREKQKQAQVLRLLVANLEATEVAPPPSFNAIAQAYKTASFALEQARSLQMLLKQIEQSRERAQRSQALASQAQIKFHQRTKGSLCPICQTPIA